MTLEIPYITLIAIIVGASLTVCICCIGVYCCWTRCRGRDQKLRLEQAKEGGLEFQYTTRQTVATEMNTERGGPTERRLNSNRGTARTTNFDTRRNYQTDAPMAAGTTNSPPQTKRDKIDGFKDNNDKKQLDLSVINKVNKKEPAF